MSATPRTDKAEAKVPGFYTCATVPSRLARELELENGELREALLDIEANLTGKDCLSERLADSIRRARAALARSGKGEA